MNNNLEFENEDPSPDSIEDNHPRTNYGEGYYEEPKQEAIEEASELSDVHKMYVGEEKRLIKKGFIAGAKWQQEKMYSEEEMINFAEFVATYTDKNRNVNGEMLHAKSKYDGAERTIDLLEKWFEQFKKK
jgi:hypothetical protein